MKRILLGCLLAFPMSAAPTTLIFDIGGIVVKYDWWPYVQHLGAKSMINYMWQDGKLPWQLSKDMQKNLFEVLASVPLEPEEGFLAARTSDGVELPYVFCAYQSGLIDSKDARKMGLDALKLFQEAGRVSNSAGEVIARTIDVLFDLDFDAGCAVALPKGMELIKELAQQVNPDGSKKYTLLGLTNWSLSFPKVRERVAGLEYFHDIITSAQAGTVKPNAGAYNYAIQKYKLNPDDCIFVDDRLENVEAAKACGIKNSLLFTDHSTLRKQLSDLGILPSRPTRWWFF
jgi:FMN phosphatase YigB (HAD superfamily)